MRYSAIKFAPWLNVGVAVLAFALSVDRLQETPRQTVKVEMQVAVPLFVQVVMAGGDRFLAANLGAIRALVADNFKMASEQFPIMAKVQGDVSWLNPGHEDNYYVAAAILPWNGEYDTAQRILARATVARPLDYQPAFYYAFNLLQFHKDAVSASAWLRASAERLPEGNNRLQMQNLAARWIEKAEDPDLAIGVVTALAQQAKRPDFRRYLELRIERLKALKILRAAAEQYRLQRGHPISALEDLVTSGIIDALPNDSLGIGYGVDDQGNVLLSQKAKK